MRVFLIGFMGTGKTTVAYKLSEILGWPVMEMDYQIEKDEQMTISEIFEKYGESYFRELETGLLKTLDQKKDLIVSCGGGTPLRVCNVEIMKETGPVIWLTASPETVWNRVKNNTERPLLKNNMSVEFIAGLMDERKGKYQFAADIIINTDEKTSIQICNEIIEKIRQEGKHND